MTNTPHGQVPEALRLAEEITNLECSSEAVAKTIAAAADELCRLHVENASLRASPAASPTPPVEQQTQPGAVYAELPEPDFGPGRYLGKATGDAYTKEQLRDFADRTHALRMQAAPKAAPGVPYQDSTPHLSVGDSSFESWYSSYCPAHKADKQRARDAYAAGMGDPLVRAAPQQEAQEPAFWMNEKGHTWSHSDWKQFPKHRAKYPIPLYPHFPTPQPAPDCHHRPPCDECAALAAQGGK